MKIYLAPSNQNANLYAAGNTNEAVQCQAIAAILKDKLVASGYECIIGADTKSIPSKAREANEWGADAYVSIHTNAGGGQGTNGFYNPERKGSLELTTAIYNRLAPLTPGKDRGLTASTAYLDLNRPAMACTMLEIEFHDWPTGTAWIIDNKSPIAQAFLLGIMDALPTGGEKERLQKQYAANASIIEALQTDFERIKEKAHV